MNGNSEKKIGVSALFTEREGVLEIWKFRKINISPYGKNHINCSSENSAN